MGGLVGGALAIGGALLNRKGAKDAQRSQERAAQAGIDEQRAARDQFQQNISPYLGAGTNALAQLQALNSGDASSFKLSPDYQFAFDQGLQGVDRSAAARGALRSGGTDADRIAFGQGLATQNYNNFYNRIANLAAMGQASAVGAGAAGQQSANAIAGLYGQQGQAGANGAINSANAINNGLAGLGGAIGQIASNWGGQRQSAYNASGGNNNLGSLANFGNNVDNFKRWS